MEKSDQIVTWSSEELLGLGHVKFYRCSFCKRGFSNAQALGGHMNIHRRDRARLREFSSDQNLLSLDINNSVYPPPSPRPPPPPADDDLLQREESLYDEAITCSSSKRPCVIYHEENDHPTSKVNDDHNPPPPRPAPAPAVGDLFQPEVSSYDETIFSSSLKRPCVTYDEENDHLITSKVNYYDHNHELMIIGDPLQLHLFKETPLTKEASSCMEGQVENKGMQLNPVSELDLELRLGMEPLESSTEMDLRFELYKS